MQGIDVLILQNLRKLWALYTFYKKVLSKCCVCQMQTTWYVFKPIYKIKQKRILLDNQELMVLIS